MNDKETGKQTITNEMVGRIRKLRGQWMTVSILAWSAMVLSGLAGIWLIASAVDYTWELPLSARRALAFGSLLLCSVSVLVLG